MADKTRYETLYKEQIVNAMREEFGYASVMQVPKLVKIVVNMGVGGAHEDAKLLENAIGDMVQITGQRPVRNKARMSISNFKIREGWSVGASVTLRGRLMYDFLDRFINIAVPRIRDFRGFSIKSFDGRGNYSLGMKEQVIFPEIEYDKIDKVRGMDITIVTTAVDDKEGYALLKKFGMPFASLNPS